MSESTLTDLIMSPYCSGLRFTSAVVKLVDSRYYFTPLARLLCKMESPSVVQKFTIMVRATCIQFKLQKAPGDFSVSHCNLLWLLVARLLFNWLACQIPVSIVVALITGIISKIIELAVISILIAVTHASFHQGVDEVRVVWHESYRLQIL